jgi:hypothetical protein
MTRAPAALTDPSAFPEGLYHEALLLPSLGDLVRGIAEDLQVNATAPVAEDIGAPVCEAAPLEIRGDDHHIRVTGHEPIPPRPAPEEHHPLYTDASGPPALQGPHPSDDPGSQLPTHWRSSWLVRRYSRGFVPS